MVPILDTVYFDDGWYIPMEAGRVLSLDYWYEGLPNWVPLTDPCPVVAVGTEYVLLVNWGNVGDVSVTGRVVVNVLKPDGSVVVLTAKSGQDTVAATGFGGSVEFNPFIIDMEGDYVATVVLTNMTTMAELDRVSMYLATTQPPEDIWSMIGSMMVMMMMMSMVSMVSESLEEA